MNDFHSLKFFQGVYIKENSVLVTYGYHPREDYSVDIAHALEKEQLENVIVKRYEWKHRNVGKILSENKAQWGIDLHSEDARHLQEPHEFCLKSPSLGGVGWGWQHDYNGLMKDFFDKYYKGEEVLTYGPHAGKDRLNMHAGFLTLALLWYKPFEQSLQLVENLGNHLKRASR